MNKKNKHNHYYNSFELLNKINSQIIPNNITILYE